MNREEDKTWQLWLTDWKEASATDLKKETGSGCKLIMENVRIIKGLL